MGFSFPFSLLVLFFIFAAASAPATVGVAAAAVSEVSALRGKSLEERRSCAADGDSSATAGALWGAPLWGTPSEPS